MQKLFKHLSCPIMDVWTYVVAGGFYRGLAKAVFKYNVLT